MTDFVVDASVAVKWVVEEPDTPQAVALRRGNRLMAPELLVAECANILWRKCRLGEVPRDVAILAARLLQASDIELLPTRALLEPATQLALSLDHPAYDCLYLALAVAEGCRFVTADERFAHVLAAAPGDWRAHVMTLAEAGGR